MWGRILVVDDSEILLDAIATALRLAGYAVDTAADGAEALKRVNRHRPDALVLDCCMPVLDGFGVVRELERRGIDIPLIVTTANERGKDWAQEMGAQAFLPKPFSTAELLAAIEGLNLPDEHRPRRPRRAA